MNHARQASNRTLATTCARPAAIRATELLWIVPLFALLVLLLASGCRRTHVLRDSDCYVSDQFQTVEYPNLCDKSCNRADDLHTHTPPTISNWQELAPWELTLEQAIEQSLQNSKVIQKLGGRVVATPAAVQTIYDPAIQHTDPTRGVDAALSAFDAQLNSSFFIAESSQVGFAFGGGGGTPIINRRSKNTLIELSKQSASGTRFTLRNSSVYADNGNSVFLNTVDTLLQAEVRQPLLRGLGAEVNRIAGPNATPGLYNGVLIARINNDITLADFESSIRDLVRDVERSYWELYFAYRNLDSLLEAREAARQVWENRKARLDNGLGRPDEEAQARQQYYSFETQVENALSGTTTGSPGVFGSERELRRMLGAATADGSLIRPVSEPVVSRIALDWDNAQGKSLDRRVELRRQKWVVRQRELELLASRKLNRFRLDLVGQYGYRGIDDIKDGGIADIFAAQNYLENWNMGVEFSGPIGKRQFHAAVRNAELRLVREKALLREQQRQILHDLNAAYTEVDRAFNSIKSTYNNLVAVEEELEPKRRRAEAGEEEIFFLLDAQQRATNIRTSLHRAIVDYNLALLNFAYAGGDLLDRYQITMAEGSWCDAAHANSERSIHNFKTVPGEYEWSESQPVSQGNYAQQTADTSSTYYDESQSYDGSPIAAPEYETESSVPSPAPATDSRRDSRDNTNDLPRTDSKDNDTPQVPGRLKDPRGKSMTRDLNTQSRKSLYLDLNKLR